MSESLADPGQISPDFTGSREVLFLPEFRPHSDNSSRKIGPLQSGNLLHLLLGERHGLLEFL